MQHFQPDQASLERDRDQQRIAIAVEYNGSQFHGWQRQTKPAVPTIQQCLEQALSSVADHPVSLTCAGRTDAGVHAVGQLAHFDVSVSRELKAWVKGQIVYCLHLSACFGRSMSISNFMRDLARSHVVISIGFITAQSGRESLPV